MTYMGGIAAIALGLALTAGAASAQEMTNQTIDTYFGTGNSTCCWATTTDDGLQLGLKAQTRGVAGPLVPTGDLYTEALGTNFNIDYSVDPSMGYGTSLDGLTFNLTITDLGTNVSASFNPALVPDNAHDLAKPGAFQNSEFVGFGFLLGSDYHNNVNDTYSAVLTASGGNLQSPFSNTIYVQQGTGLAGFNPPGVPEPASWALMIVGFGSLGAMMRSRKRSIAAAA